MEDKKKLIEPMPLFGVESIIYSKEEALQILKSNSYYIFVAAVIMLFGFIGIAFFDLKIGITSTYALIWSFVYFAIGFLIRIFQSRVASITSLLIFSYIFISNFIESGISGLAIFSIIFIAASYRSTKASFFYHSKKQ